MKSVTVMKGGDKIRSNRSTRKEKHLPRSNKKTSSEHQNAIGGRKGVTLAPAVEAETNRVTKPDHIDGDKPSDQTEEGRSTTSHPIVIDDDNQGYSDDDTQPGAYHEGGSGQSLDLDPSPLEETTTNNNNESLITAELAPDIDEEVARRLEERLEERGRDMDEEINRQLEERVGKAVVATKVVSSNEQRRVQRKRIVAAVLFTAFVSFLVAFFLMKRRQENLKTSSPTPSPTLTEFEYIRQAVTMHLSYDDETVFYNESSAQYKAIEWLMHNDTLQLHRSTTSGSPMSAALVERYVLAMIYFNNGGPYWTNSYNFLNESVSVCEWNLGTSTSDGVQCDDSGNVVDLILKLGKEAM